MANSVRPITRLRSLLFAPAVRPDFLEKLPRSGADGVVIDCEDATPPDAKAEARGHARRLAPSIARGQHAPQVFVRVNAVPTNWFSDDIAEALSPELTGIIVPKLDRLEQFATIESTLETAGLGELGVLAGIETALGVADARELLAHPRVVAGYFGAEDFIADMGGQRTEVGEEVAYARSQVALAARLAGVPVLDQVVTDFRNDERMAREVREARAIGYGGKLCIHPGQVAIVNDGFLPSPEECESARRLLEAYERAAIEGIGAIEFEGQMVDEPLAARARQVLASAGDAQ